MRNVLACCGIAGFMALSGPLGMLEAEQAARISTPEWIALPAGGAVTTVAYTGSIGAEAASGTIELAFDHDAARDLSALKARLAVNGYLIEERLGAVDSFMGAASFAVATDPATGRSLRIVEIPTPMGDHWRISFTDPVDQVAQLEY